MLSREKISVILPTFNEKDNIVPLIQEIQSELSSWANEIIVVDDGSPDGTAAAVRKLNDPGITVLHREQDPGLARAILAGIRQSDGGIVVVMDSDFNHQPGYLPYMIKNLADCDCVLASRFLPGGGMQSRLRFWVSKFFSRWINFMTGNRFSDNLYGFFAVKREFLMQCPLEKIFFGFGEYYFRLLYYFQKNRVRALEFPASNGGEETLWSFALLKLFVQYFLGVLLFSGRNRFRNQIFSKKQEQFVNTPDSRLV